MLLEWYNSNLIYIIDWMFDRKDALHRNDLNWTLKASWFATNGSKSEIASVQCSVFRSEVMLVVKDTECATNKCIYRFLEIWDNAWRPILTEPPPFSTLRRRQRIRMLQSIRLFKKIKYSRHSIFGKLRWKQEPQTKKKNPLQNARKFYHCSFKGCLGFIFIYIIIYSLSYM